MNLNNNNSLLRNPNPLIRQAIHFCSFNTTKDMQVVWVLTQKQEEHTSRNLSVFRQYPQFDRVLQRLVVKLQIFVHKSDLKSHGKKPYGRSCSDDSS